MKRNCHKLVTPRCSSVVRRLFLSIGHFSCKLRRNFCPSLDHLEKPGALSIQEVITEAPLIYLKGRTNSYLLSTCSSYPEIAL